MKKRFSTRTLIQVCITLFFVVTVVLPLLNMIMNITQQGLSNTLGSEQFRTAVKNSISTGLVSTAISLSIAMMAAWCLERTSIRLKTVFSLIFVLPMLLPSISHAFGLVALLGSNGVITKMLGLSMGIYGFWGIVVGSVMYSFPVAFMMFSNILHYEDALPYEAATVLGIPPVRQLTGITLPYMKKTLISASFAVFTMVVTDYGVPLMIGGKTTTLAVLMYNKAVAMIDYNAGSVIGTVLLVPAIAAFIVDLLNPENGVGSFVSKPIVKKRGWLGNMLAYAFCAVILLCIIAPVISFIIIVFETKYPVDTSFTLYHITKTMNRGAGTYLLNSIMYSALTGVVGTFLGFCCAYMTTRVRGSFGNVLHLFSIVSMAIPGIVLGLSYLLFFSGTPIYGGIFIIVLVNSMHFFSSPYMMMRNAMVKLNPDLESVGFSLGVSRIKIIIDVIVPKMKLTICEMFVYFFVNSMMTISAVSFLAPPAPKPLSLMINQFEAQRLMESAAFVSLLILFVNFITKLIMQLVKKYCFEEA